MDNYDISLKNSNKPFNGKLVSRHISVVLENFLENFPGKYITLGEIKDQFSHRVFSVPMLLFALPNLVPLPIPGISTVLGIPLVILSYQLAKGMKVPRLPKGLANKSLERSKIEKIILYILPYIKRLECILKPRLSFLLEPTILKIIAVICLIMSIIMVIPLPLGNWFPALTICLFSLAILERDGMLVLLGLISAIISIGLISTVLLALFKAFWLSIEKLF